MRLLLFQGGGEVVSHGLSLPIPRPVVGLVLLLGWLLWRGEVDENTDTVARAFSQHLGLLFIPAAVGVVAYWPTLLANWAPVGVGLLVSVVVAISVTALVLKLLGGKPQ
ncbi:MAG: CidA/LrgA family protein [Candidatus Protistobacter heckmanni]|nr:CidA/LrgA family protein [Candidatus Protistobacter heckmanni]